MPPHSTFFFLGLLFFFPFVLLRSLLCIAVETECFLVIDNERTLESFYFS